MQEAQLYLKIPLLDSRQERSHGRRLFKFKPKAVEGEEEFSNPLPMFSKARRVDPTVVKLEVGKRDEGNVPRVKLPKIYASII